MFKRGIKGIIRGCLISLILNALFLVILSLIMMNTELKEEKYNFIYSLITIASLAVGSLYAGKYIGKKGILIGLSIGIIFSIITGFFISINSEGMFMGGEMLKRTLINSVIGIISGVLGVNL